ncbi:calcium/sodium antiporter [Gudongella oleilytica]|uniref:calcium/sodium antiporter n=1 Tax=Gudongella oleilytica TaxID=1582259 RepID=UPI002A36E62B|nr:calcium/sodium antiporter [Gudongella oleilytica]MDY0257411.1 calcium/sodium antiporter [Gudongella oleilytica]
MNIVFFIIGLALLVAGANYFVDGAAGIAKRLKVSALLIGLTVVAFGTSAPEVAVSISASLKGNNGIALGNVLGSNIFNLSFILGAAAIIFPLSVERQTIKKEIPIMILSALSLFALGVDSVIDQNSNIVISRGDGLMLLLLFASFIYYVIEVARNSREVVELLDNPIEGSTFKLIIKTAGGLAFIIAGGYLVVESAVEIATSLGLSQTFIGLTIVAIGTSLPELVTSIIASIKKNPEIAVGNVVGSNIFNAFFILGASAVISPIAVNSSLIIDMTFNIILSFILLFFSISHRSISKKEGGALLLTFFAYNWYLIASI